MTEHMMRYAMGAAGIFLVLAALGTMADLEEDDDPAPLPFDPLSGQEREEAVGRVLQDTGISQTLSERFVVIGAALYTDKAMRDLESWPRMAEVWLYDYEVNQAIRALVNLQEQEVTQWETPDIQPPITAAEIEHAAAMALEDARVQDHLQQTGVDPARVEWTGRLWTGPEPTACPENRCMLVGFIDDESFVHSFTVLVDLTTDRVVHLLGPHGTPLNAEEPSGGLV